MKNLILFLIFLSSVLYSPAISQIKDVKKDSLVESDFFKQDENEKIKDNNSFNSLDTLEKVLRYWRYGNDIEGNRYKKKSKNLITNNIYDPINWTLIRIRRKSENGKHVTEILPNRSSKHFIKPESEIIIEFDQLFVRELFKASKLKLRVTAYLERPDKSIIPLGAKGLTQVTLIEQATESAMLINLDKKKDEFEISDKYQINYLKSSSEKLSTQIDLSNINESEGDIIKLSITNEDDDIQGMGFDTTLEYINYGWEQGATGGFSFIKTSGAENKTVTTAGTAGYYFKFETKPSATFLRKLINPSFGPELNVLENGDQTLFGLGGFISTLANTVRFGYGIYLNGLNQQSYLSIGINFIEGIDTISGLLQKTK